MVEGNKGPGPFPYCSADEFGNGSLQLPPHLVRRAQHLSDHLREKERALRLARRRGAELRRALADQADATQRAHREVLVGRLKLMEADHAITRARGGTLVSSLAALGSEKKAAERERDSARGVVVQLTIRVEQLGAETGSGPGAVVRRAHERLAALLERLTGELALLEDDLDTLRAAGAHAASTRTKAAAATSLRPMLEDRWIQLAVTSDSSGGSPSTEVIVCPRSPRNDVFLPETEVWSRALQQMIEDFDEICPLLHS